MTAYQKMKSEYNSLGDNIQAKKKFIENNKSAFSDLGLAVNGLSDAEKVFYSQTDAVTTALMMRAKAAAAASMAQDSYKKMFEKMVLLELKKQQRDEQQRLAKKNGTEWVDENQNREIETLEKGVENYNRAAILWTKTSGIYSTKASNEIKSVGIKTHNNNENKNPDQVPSSREKQEMLNQQILKNEQDLNAERLAIMEDGRKKRLLLSEQEWKEKKDLLTQEYNDLVAQNKETPKEAKDIFEARLKVNDQAKTKRNDKINQEFDTQDAKLQKQLSAVYLSEEEKRKQAIRERYDEMRKGQKDEYEKQVEIINNTKQGKEAWDESIQALVNYLAILDQINAAETFEANKEEVDNFDYKKITAFEQAFSDVKDRTVTDMHTIADRAAETLNFVKAGTWDNAKGMELGISQKDFDLLQKSPEKVKKIQDGIKNLKQEANNCDTAFGKIGSGVKDLFDPGTGPNETQKAFALIKEGFNEVMQYGQLMSSTLSSLGDAFGSEALGNAAEGIGIAMDAAQSAMQGAEAGLAIGGPIGAAAGAAIGLVSSLASSLSKLHDGKLQKEIEASERAVKKLGWAYEDLERAKSKANSSQEKDIYSQKMVDNLKQQQEELSKQQNAEGKKKKSDKEKMEDLARQRVEIQQQIEDIEEERFNERLQENIEASERASKKLEWAFSDLKRAMDKTLGESKYDYLPKLFDNIKQKQAELQKQIEEEGKKTSPDQGKLDDLQRQITTLEQEKEDIIEGLKNDFLGGSEKDIAQRLGDAFIEAFAKGEDAAKAWNKSVKEIVGDIVKRMLITKLFEKPIEDIFDKFWEMTGTLKDDKQPSRAPALKYRENTTEQTDNELNLNTIAPNRMSNRNRFANAKFDMEEVEVFKPIVIGGGRYAQACKSCRSCKSS